MENLQIAWYALISMDFIHLQGNISFVLCQGAKKSLTLETISPTSASPEAHRPRMNAKWKSCKPSVEPRLNYTKPLKQVRSH